MRRIEILQGVERVRSALAQSNLARAIMNAAQQRKSPPEAAKPLFKALKTYNVMASQFQPVDRQIAKIMGLDMFEDTDNWIHLIMAGEPGMLFEAMNRAKFADEHVAKFIKLLETDATRLSTATPEASSRGERQAVLTVVVIEEHQRFSRPGRLINALESISDLYEGVAILQKVQPAELAVVGCDSGSDKSIDFLGAAKVMDAIKEIILSLWDRVVFYRERKIETRIDLIAKSLPVLEQVTALEDQGAVGPEQAEILRRKIIGGSSKFLETGLAIPEIETRTSFNPRVLLAAQPRLLTAPTADALSKEEESVEEQPKVKKRRKKGEESKQ